MKNQRREFVVEYKTRRRTQVGLKSIWSGIDLKSASKAVDVDENLPFKQLDPGPAGVDNTTSLKQGSTSVPTTLPAVSSARGDSPLSANASPPITDETGKTVAQVRSEDRPSTPQQRVRMRASKRLARERDLIAVEESPIAKDELEKLEAENARLKLALRARLLRDNAVLRAKLKRFDR